MVSSEGSPIAGGFFQGKGSQLVITKADESFKRLCIGISTKKIDLRHYEKIIIISGFVA